MTRRKTEPVRHTCPDINRMISTITDIVNEMNDCDDRYTNDDLLTFMRSWSSDLESIGVGKWCDLEDLRNSNSALRDWGNEMYDDAELLEAERDDYECKCCSLESKINELENEIYNLEIK